MGGRGNVYYILVLRWDDEFCIVGVWSSGIECVSGRGVETNKKGLGSNRKAKAGK